LPIAQSILFSFFENDNIRIPIYRSAKDIFFLRRRLLLIRRPRGARIIATVPIRRRRRHRSRIPGDDSLRGARASILLWRLGGGASGDCIRINTITRGV